MSAFAETTGTWTSENRQVAEDAGPKTHLVLHVLPVCPLVSIGCSECIFVVTYKFKVYARMYTCFLLSPYSEKHLLPTDSGLQQHSNILGAILLLSLSLSLYIYIYIYIYAYRHSISSHLLYSRIYTTIGCVCGKASHKAYSVIIFFHT
jgi:hypothetical protein